MPNSNGTLELLREIDIIRKTLKEEFQIDSAVAETVTGETTWSTIKVILNNDSALFMEFIVEIENKLGIEISDEMIAMNRPLEDLCS